MTMTLVVLSDIHGNLPALRAVIDSLPDHDAVVVAGDLCLDGPWPSEVLDTLDQLGWLLLMGNTDRDLVWPSPDLKERKRHVVEWTREQLGPDHLQALAALPFSRSIDGGNGETILVVHANPLNLDDHLRPEMSERDLQPYLEPVQVDILAFGHFHIPYVRPVGDLVLVDVASVGHPKDHDCRAAYTVIRWDEARRSITQNRVPYDMEETVHALRRSGMPHAEKQIDDLIAASYEGKEKLYGDTRAGWPPGGRSARTPPPSAAPGRTKGGYPE